MGSILLFATLTISMSSLICLGLVHKIIVELNLVLNRKFNIYFCRWTRLTITQEAVLSPSESLANTSVSEKVSYEIN